MSFVYCIYRQQHPLPLIVNLLHCLILYRHLGLRTLRGRKARKVSLQSCVYCQARVSRFLCVSVCLSVCLNVSVAHMFSLCASFSLRLCYSSNFSVCVLCVCVCARSHLCCECSTLFARMCQSLIPSPSLCILCM